MQSFEMFWKADVQSFNVPFYVSVPKNHISEAKRILPAHIQIVCDDDILELVPGIDKSAPQSGWFSQQIVKANAWRLMDCDNYLSIDSDGFFIREFSVYDFMHDDDTPYTVCHEQKDLFSWTCHNTEVLGFNPKGSFTLDRKQVMNLFGRSRRVYDFGPNPVIWSRKVWVAFQEILDANEWTFQNAMDICPSEFTWYGETLLATKAIELMPCEPLFKGFHYEQQYLDYKATGITQEHLAQNYMGIVLQSTFSNRTLEY